VITILNGLQPNGEEACAECGLVPVLNGLEQVEAWAALARRLSRRLPAALQVDSGMTRLGLSAAEVERVAEHDLLGTLDVRLVMSHLACADEPAHPANAAQRDAFNGLLRQLPKTRVSFANSGGILLGEGFVHDLARPGLALYGVNPIPEQSVALRPVVRLDARVIQVRSVPKNTAIGYGAAFTSTRPMRLATIAVGYADGWPRHLSDKGAAFAGDVSLPIVGRVSMDSTIIDISALSDDALHLGSLVELIGPHQTLDDVAAKAGTIPYEILTGLGRRYARHYLDHEAEAPASMKGGVAP
jgi:alanine racemase